MVSSGGKAGGITVEEGGAYIGADVVATDMVIHRGEVFFDKGGSAVRYSSGSAVRSNFVMERGLLYINGGRIEGAIISNGCIVELSSGGRLAEATIAGANVWMNAGASISNVTVTDGGTVRTASGSDVQHVGISSGGILTGVMCDVSDLHFDGGVLQLDVSCLPPGNDFLVDQNTFGGIDPNDDYSVTLKIQTVPTYSDNGLEEGGPGTYRLIEGAAGFNKTITVLNPVSEEIGTLTLGKTSKIEGYGFTLNLDANNNLTVTVSDEDPGPMPVSVAKGDVDGNGISDVLFQYTGGDYQLGYWMNGTNEWRGQGLAKPAEWEVLGSYDMNSNGCVEGLPSQKSRYNCDFPGKTVCISRKTSYICEMTLSTRSCFRRGIRAVSSSDVSRASLKPTQGNTMPITEILERNAQLYKDDVALVEINPQELEKRHTTWREYSLMEPSPTDSFRSELTWGEFDRKANRVANFLLTRHIKKGNRVGILLMNCLEWLPIYFGVLKSGAMAVPLNFRYTAEEIKYCIELADIDVLIFGPSFIGRVESICERIPRVKALVYVGEDCPSFAEPYYNLVSYCSSKSPAIPLSDEEDAAIYFSSGTTGFPKAIVHRHRSLMHACIVEQKHHGQTREDTFLCIPPLYHTGAKMHWFGSFLVGGKAVLLRGIKPEWIISAVSEEHCTVVWLLVPWAQDILDAIDRGDIKLEDYKLDQWRLMHIGAQPVPPSLIKRWKTVFPKHDYDTNYGLSESIGPGAVHLGIENIDHVGAIGVAGYGWQTKIVDEKHNIVEPGKVGELAVKGDGVMRCYYKDEKATKEVLDDEGWLYTGDMAKEEDGFIYLVDRKKDVIITGGENLYPVQIEDFLRRNNAIKDVAVIGLPDPRLGEIAAAIIEVKPDFTLTEEQVNDFCLDLPRYQRPRKIIFAEVPRNPTGKIEKPKLRKMYGADKLVAMQNEIK